MNQLDTGSREYQEMYNFKFVRQKKKKKKILTLSYL